MFEAVWYDILSVMNILVVDLAYLFETCVGNSQILSCNSVVDQSLFAIAYRDMHTVKSNYLSHNYIQPCHRLWPSLYKTMVTCLHVFLNCKYSHRLNLLAYQTVNYLLTQDFLQSFRDVCTALLGYVRSDIHSCFQCVKPLQWGCVARPHGRVLDSHNCTPWVCHGLDRSGLLYGRGMLGITVSHDHGGVAQAYYQPIFHLLLSNRGSL